VSSLDNSIDIVDDVPIVEDDVAGDSIL
jgi:hypothetical protein